MPYALFAIIIFFTITYVGGTWLLSKDWNTYFHAYETEEKRTKARNSRQS